MKMTDETLADKRRRQADAAERHGDLGTAWTFREDADALDAKDARIAELERERDMAIRAMSDASAEAGRYRGELEVSQWPGVVDGWKRRAEAAEAKCERYATALQHLSFVAQTTGGTAGPDKRLQEAIVESEQVLRGTALTTDLQDNTTTA